jgi:agmatinase
MSTIGPEDPRTLPRFAGSATFGRLPRRDQVDHCDVAILGVPFDSGATFRTGTRFGPIGVRAGSRLLRGYNLAQDVMPFADQQVADAGDVGCNPFDIAEALEQIRGAAEEQLAKSERLLAIGGDHTITLPLLRAVTKKFGPVGLVHFDAHLDTWDTYFGVATTHGTTFRRASEEGLLDRSRLVHIGIRGPLFTKQDMVDDAGFGFETLTSADVAGTPPAAIAERVKRRVGDAPVFVSVDIDVLDPAFAPGTGTPEPGGLSTRELLALLRGLKGINIVAADHVEVSPPFDHAEITAIAAASVVYELVSLMAARHSP